MDVHRSDNQSYQISLKLLMRNERGQLLVLRLPDDSPMKGYYDFPGGRIAESEVLLPFASTMEREIKEELGEAVQWELVSPKPAGISLHHYTSRRYGKEIYVVWVLFEARYLSGDIIISDEHADYQWIDFQPETLSHYFTRGVLAAARNYFGLES